MNYHRNNITDLKKVFSKCSVVLLHGRSQNFLFKEAKEISNVIAGPNAEQEMRLTTFSSQEISEKKHEIISSLKTRSFFPGPSVRILNGLMEKDYNLILDLERAWQIDDPMTIITMDELSRNSKIRKSTLDSSSVALVEYQKQSFDRKFILEELDGRPITSETLEAVIDYSNFIPESLFYNELEKLKMYKLYDETPLEIDDFWKLVSLDYEVSELGIAIALAERNLLELDKKLNVFFSTGKSPNAILYFIGAYFYKLTLIKLYGIASYEVKREFPFLIAKDMSQAKILATKWTLNQLRNAINSLTILDLEMRNQSSLFQSTILVQGFNKIMET